MYILSALIPGIGHYHFSYKKKGIIFSLSFLAIILTITFLVLLLSFPYNILSCLGLLFLFYYSLFTDLKQIILTKKKSPTKKKKKFINLLPYSVIFLILLQTEINVIQKQILFGYKAVTNDMKPVLIDGDHYFADKLLYKLKGPQTGDIFVYRNKKDDIKVKRIVACPGEKIFYGKKEFVISRDEFAFLNDSESSEGKDAIELIPKKNLVGKAFMNYWTYNADNMKIVWNRIGNKIQ